MALSAKQNQEAADRQAKEQQMTPKQAEQPEQPKQRKPRWSKEQKAAAKAQREQGSAEQPKPDAEQSEQPKAQERPKKQEKQEKQEKPAEGTSEPTQKSWDAELASRPFKDMLAFRRSEHDSKRGIAVGTLKEYQKEAAKGTRPIRELYHTVQMGEGSDPGLSSPYDPEVHKTDSTPKKL